MEIDWLLRLVLQPVYGAVDVNDTTVSFSNHNLLFDLFPTSKLDKRIVVKKVKLNGFNQKETESNPIRRKKEVKRNIIIIMKEYRMRRDLI